MKKPQLYPDLCKIRIVRFKKVIEAVVIHKNKSQYAISFKNPNTGTPYIEYRTENRLTKEIEDAIIADSPLYKAMREE